MKIRKQKGGRMASERDKIIKALKTAIDIETDGKECYLEASRESRNEVGKKLLEELSLQEDEHRRKFIRIYRAIEEKKGWPHIDFQPNRSKKLRESFIKGCEVLGVSVSAASSEFDALKIAIEKEKKSYDFYNRQVQSAAYDAERSFYQALAAEEREHEMILVDYYEYLSNPADWFTRTERHSLDAG
jgi:rubrerythrin